MENVERTAAFVRARLGGEGSGHDWWHTFRVWTVARSILEHYPQADAEIVELSALLHDVADWKDPKSDDSFIVEQFLETLALGADRSAEIKRIIDSISFKGTSASGKLPLEAQIVQDADRLDALGAIGIARTFAYAGKKGQLLHDGVAMAKVYSDQEDYVRRHDSGTALNHFYEKLLLVKDLMNTDVAREMAESRHRYLQAFLEQFLREWEGLSTS